MHTVSLRQFCTVRINLNCEVDMSTKALILAGGSGTRFWPKSTKDKPKQFLRITFGLKSAGFNRIKVENWNNTIN